MHPIAITARTGAALLGVGLCVGCVGRLPSVVERVADVEAVELRRLPQCGRGEATAAVHLLGDEAALRSWQGARGIELIGSETLPAGAFAVVELGARESGGYGLAISRRAREIGNRLQLVASVLTPKPGSQPAPTPTSPCVLVRLPIGLYDRVDVRDSTGSRLAISPAPVLAPAAAPLP